MKKYVLIAGVNGVGKSTLCQLVPNLRNLPRINPDEILQEFGNWRKPSDMLAAGKIAIERISTYLENGTSFSQETTLCGHSILRNINSAKQKGYSIELHYIGIESPELAKQRVRLRVQKGGHGIPEKYIERRYFDSLNNLKKILDICDLVAFYDNTKSFYRFAIYKNGIPVRLSKNIPTWFEKHILNK